MPETISSEVTISVEASLCSRYVAHNEHRFLISRFERRGACKQTVPIGIPVKPLMYPTALV